MSEADKIRRLQYKQNRKKWIIIQASAILLVVAVALSMAIVYSNLSKTYYVSYTDEGSTDYNVALKDNDFFESNTISNGKGYITELIDKINATFRYEMKIDASNVRYEYTSYVEATLQVIDQYTDKVLYSPSFILSGKETEKSRDSMEISEIVSIDYQKYNTLASEFVDAYALENVDCRLVVTMYADITGSSDSFTGRADNDYSSSVIIPLYKKTVSIETSASAPDGAVNLLPCKRDTDPTVFEVLAIVFACLALILAGMLTAFIYITRNDDINYEIKVKKLLSSYRSYIQIITNGFDTEGYQILVLGSFNEMLGIRDTIQSPILMSENADKTRTLFLIPTNTKILYVFEIKADDYDELYAEPAPEPAPMPEPTPEPESAEEVCEPAPEPETVSDTEEPAPEPEDGVEVIDVKWPEHKNKENIYKYDPNGESLERGDIVLVPSHDIHQNKDIIRQASVVRGNYKIDPSALPAPLRKIIGVVKRGICSKLEN